MSELVLDVERQYQGGNVLTITFTDRIYVNLLIITLQLYDGKRHFDIKHKH